MLPRIVSLTVLGLVLSTPLASATCNAISRSRLVTCACNGAPAIASYCVYYRGGACSVDLPGNYCGSDDSGHDCYIGSTRGYCLSNPRRAQLRTNERATAEADLAALIPTCGGVPLSRLIWAVRPAGKA